MKRALEVVSIVALVSMWVMLAAVYNSAPEQIPNYFNMGWRRMITVGKGSLWLLPILATNYFIFLSAAARLTPKQPGADPMPLIAVKAGVMTLLAVIYFVRLP